MTHIASVLKELGWILRSGGADGADIAFADGAGNQLQEFLPWHNFNGRTNGYYISHTREVYELAEKYWNMRPYRCDWYSLKDTTKLLMMRNVYQILGPDLQTPSECVICWTPNGEHVGGTAMALTIAFEREIPIFNLAHTDTMDRMEEFFAKP